MAEFTFEELCRATGGSLFPSDAAGRVAGINTDSRKEMKEALFLALSGEKFDAHSFLEDAVRMGAEILCIEEAKKDLAPAGVPLLLVKDTLKAYQDIAHFHRMRFPGLTLIALTGSCGKTSTKEALRAIFSAHYGKDAVLATEGNTNNQVGVPRNLLRLTQAHKAAVIEMGTNHPGEIAPLARCAEGSGAMIVSIGSCHLEFFIDHAGVAKEKSAIFTTLPASGGKAVLPLEASEADFLRKAAENTNALIYTFGESEKADMGVKYLGGNLAGSSFELYDRTGEKEETIRVSWSLSGKHQACNAAGAAAMARHFGIPLQTIAAGLAETSLPGMRMRQTPHGGSLWLNDAYNANPDSMRSGLLWLADFADPAETVLVLGDMGELGDGALREHMKCLSFARLLFPGTPICCIGRRMGEALAMLDPATADPACVAFPEPGKEALAYIEEHAGEGSIVYLKASRSTALEKLEEALEK